MIFGPPDEIRVCSVAVVAVRVTLLKKSTGVSDFCEYGFSRIAVVSAITNVCAFMLSVRTFARYSFSVLSSDCGRTIHTQAIVWFLGRVKIDVPLSVIVMDPHGSKRSSETESSC